MEKPKPIKTRKSFIPVLALLSCLSTSTFADDSPSPEVLQELRSQVARPFDVKFAPVTRDIPRQSTENLEEIEAGLRRRFGHELFEALARESEKTVQDAKSQIVIQSETSVTAAIAILKDRSFYSLDELIRRKVLPLEKKLHSATRYSIDGKIGQQDAVFVAIKPKDIPATRPIGIEWSFGDVKFLFKDSVIDRGYFTPYTFDNSPPQYAFFSGDSKLPANLGGAIQLYRKFIFSSRPAFLKLLKLSAIQKRWEEKQNSEAMYASLKDMERTFYGRTSDERRTNKSLPTGKWCVIFDLLKQPCPKEIDAGTSENLVQNQGLRIKGALGNTMKTLGAYSGFPISVDDIGIAHAHMYGFWELKVPTRLSLNDLEAIEISRTSTETTDKRLETLFQTIQAFGLATGRKPVLTESFDQAGFEEKKQWATQPDPKPFQRFRWDFKK